VSWLRLSRSWSSAASRCASVTRIGGLQRAGDRAGLPDPAQSPAGYHDHRHLRQLAEKVAHGVCLAGARCAVQQHAALEMLTAGQQTAGVLSDPEHLPLDVLKYVVGQHDLVAADRGAFEEVHRHLAAQAEHLGPEADHLAAEDAPLAGQAPDPAEDRLDPVLIRTGDLEHHFGIRTARHGLQHDGKPGLAVVHQVDAVVHAGASLPVGPAGQSGGHHAACARRPERAVMSGLEEIADPDDL
jgi:hypothetical protein